MSKSRGRGNSICVCGLQINSGCCKHSKTCCTAAENSNATNFPQKFSVESWTASYGLPAFPTLWAWTLFQLSSRWQINPLLGRQVARKLQFTLTHQLHHLPRFAGHKLGQSWATGKANEEAKACQSSTQEMCGKRGKKRETAWLEWRNTLLGQIHDFVNIIPRTTLAPAGETLRENYKLLWTVPTI